MVEIAAGQYRWAVKESGGGYVDYTAAVHYDVLNNTASPRAVLQDAIEGRPRGTVNDEIIGTTENLVAHGSYNEYVDLELYDSTARTFTTASCTVQLNVADIWFDSVARRVRVQDKPLGLTDRVTKSTSGTQQNPIGLNDNPGTVANAWSAVMRFIPPLGHNYAPRGYQRFVSDGT